MTQTNESERSGAEQDAFFYDSPRNRVVRHLRKMILSGCIASGDALPTERQIAEEFKVARGTVRAALGVLEREHLIAARKHAKRIAMPVPQTTAAMPGLLSRTFGLLTHLLQVPRVGPQSGLIGAVEAGIFNSGMQAGLHGMLLQKNSLQDGYLQMLLRGGPCGLLVTSQLFADPEAATCLEQLLAGTTIPVVLNSAALPKTLCDRVLFDHAAGAGFLTRFLIEKGCKRILRLWSCPQSTDWLQERNRGHEQAMREAGLPVLPAVCADYLPYDRALLAARARCYAGCLIEHLRKPEPPQGILVTSDCDVFAVAAACRLCGARPGEDVVIVGYDNEWQHAPELAEVGYAPAATIDKHNFAAGEAMVGLMRRRQNDETLSPQTVIITPELIIP